MILPSKYESKCLDINQDLGCYANVESGLKAFSDHIRRSEISSLESMHLSLLYLCEWLTLDLLQVLQIKTIYRVKTLRYKFLIKF